MEPQGLAHKNPPRCTYTAQKLQNQLHEVS
jgi:hypothetical protein